MKGDYDGFPIDSPGFRPEFINDLTMSHVHAIKRTNRDHGIPERGKIVYVAVYMHKVTKLGEEVRSPKPGVRRRFP